MLSQVGSIGSQTTDVPHTMLSHVGSSGSHTMEVPQTMLSRVGSRGSDGSDKPHTMLSPQSAPPHRVPHTMLSPLSAATAPHTVLSAHAFPRGAMAPCRRRWLPQRIWWLHDFELGNF